MGFGCGVFWWFCLFFGYACWVFDLGGFGFGLDLGFGGLGGRFCFCLALFIWCLECLVWVCFWWLGGLVVLV